MIMSLRRKFIKQTAGLGGMVLTGIPNGFGSTDYSNLKKQASDIIDSGGAEPHKVEINHDVQMFVDDYLVDNRWGVENQKENVIRFFHQPQKDELNPLIAKDTGYVNVVRDEVTGLFRMWYQVFWDQGYNPRMYTYAIAYAVSADGIHWKLPRIGKFSFKNTLDNNIVVVSPSGGGAEGQFILDVPSEQSRGYEFIMLYGTYDDKHRGLHLIGSHDGIDWDPLSDTLITPGFMPDTQSSIVWDPKQRKFVCFTRAVNIYDDKNGLRRRVARLESSSLWDEWPVFPENIMIPDELDEKSGHSLFYGMPMKYYAGIYWGFLWPYRNGEDVYTELTFSRDGKNFHRLPDRSHLIDLGPKNSWDQGMVFAAGWVEVEDEWWIYYTATNGGHGVKSSELNSGIGLTRIRKEGFVSLRSPNGGGVVVTRLMRWPGGKLYVNADASLGELRIQVTAYDRKPISGFDPDLSLPIDDDNIRHEVKWSDGDINSLTERAIRLEFYMKNIVDLYGFRAVPVGEQP